MPTVRTNPLILCVDDYENILAGWKLLLESEGYRVLTAENSSTAIDLFSRHPVDEVILDCQLRETLGDVVAERMKAIKPSVPILMLSGDDRLPKDRLKCAEAFLLKADSITVFLVVIKELLNTFRPQRNGLLISDHTHSAPAKTISA